jgi:uncharacterized membrane protein YhaH (DUF805 family)
MQWYLKVLRNYATFSGRARRTEYWMFTLVNAIVVLILALIDNLLFGRSDGIGVSVLVMLYSLAILLPGLAVSVRRLHDTGHSGWWLLISFVPVVGAIVLFIFYVIDSDVGANQYGPSPKEQPASGV